MPLPQRRHNNPRHRLITLVMGLPLVMLCTGCPDREKITRYKVPAMAIGETASDADLPPGHPPMTGGDAPPLNAQSGRVPTNTEIGEPTRTLAAIAPQGTVAWFFKMMGPDDAVQEQVDAFQILAESIRFDPTDKGKPSWKLPEGWSQQASSGMRLATLTVDTNPELEVSVIPLPMRGGVDEAYLRDNVNRWRNEVSLPPVSGDQWKEQANQDSTLSQFDADGVTITTVNVTGPRKASGMRPPFAGGMPPRQPAPDNSLPQPKSPPSGLAYTTPAGWKETGASGMSKAGFDIAEGDQQANVTVTLAGGDELANVNRWRGQVGLAPWSAEELTENQQSVTVDGHKGLLVNLAGDAESILGAIVDVDGRSWFIKLRGDVDLAEQQRAAFKTFVESMMF